MNCFLRCIIFRLKNIYQLICSEHFNYPFLLKKVFLVEDISCKYTQISFGVSFEMIS